MDAIALLKADHRKVQGLFRRYEKSRSNAVKAKIAQQICMELTVHTTIEEELFYPAVRGAVDGEIHDEAYVEHDGAKVLIAELLKGTPEDEFFDAKVTVLSEMIKHHVKEEEQPGGLFAQARRDHIDFDTLTRNMKALKSSMVENIKTAGVPMPATRSMKGAELERRKPVA
jgi:hypothetical protein